jgi:enoyl-CoA hydratase/carnithine racemase
MRSVNRAGHGTNMVRGEMAEQPRLDRDGDVFVMHLGDGEQRFNPEWVGAVTVLLDEVESAPAPRALVTTAAGKIYSNGLDLEWMGANPDQIGPFVTTVHELFARFLESSVPAVAAIQGHAFAAGAMIALAHDQRVMRSDRGFFCMPEIDIRIPFTPGMNALIMCRIPKLTAHEAMTTGRRYGGAEAAAAGLVDEAVDEEHVLHAALERARPLAGKDPATLKAIKTGMYAPVLETLRTPQDFGAPPS